MQSPALGVATGVIFIFFALFWWTIFAAVIFALTIWFVPAQTAFFMGALMPLAFVIGSILGMFTVAEWMVPNAGVLGDPDSLANHIIVQHSCGAATAIVLGVLLWWFSRSKQATQQYEPSSEP